MRQEACHRFTTYLQWTVPNYRAELLAVSETKDDEEDDDDDGDDNVNTDADDSEQTVGLGYSVAKTPAYPQVPITLIVTDFGATDFLPALQMFLRTSPRTSRSAILPLASTRLSLYKCLTVRLPPAPQVTKHETKDVV